MRNDGVPHTTGAPALLFSFAIPHGKGTFFFCLPWFEFLKLTSYSFA
jgi:hypothetical protein